MSGKKSNSDQTALPFVGDLLLYQTEDGQTRIEVRLQDDASDDGRVVPNHQTTTQNITLHIKTIYRDGELQEAATCKEYLHVQTEGKRNISRARKFYNLPEALHVVLAYDAASEQCHIITAYRPDLTHFEVDLITRRLS